MQKTANPNATEKAKELLNFLSEIARKAIITGQHSQTNPYGGNRLYPQRNRKGAVAKRI